MPGVSQVVFVLEHLDRPDIEGKRILDVGSRNYNGSIRPAIERWRPESYVGVDITEGRDVDLVVSATDLVHRFGDGSFDVVLCLEMLEHAPEWKACISNLKRVTRPGGTLFLTTRSPGYPCHGFPHDFWRFDVSLMSQIFADMDGVLVEADSIEPGVFVKAVRPTDWVENDLSAAKPYSIVLGTSCSELPSDYSRSAYYGRLRRRQAIKHAVSRTMIAAGGLASAVLRVRR